MSDFAVNVVEIVDPVEHHPNADRLSLIKILGYTCISAKLDDGSHRYKQGDLVVYVPEGAVVPEWLLKQGFWSEKDQKGILAGTKGDRVKALRLRGIFSQGILFPVEQQGVGKGDSEFSRFGFLKNEAAEAVMVINNDNVAEFLGITKYDPPIPEELLGEVTSLFGYTTKFDFESIQAQPELFTPGEPVVATEKINGTNCQIGYIPGLDHAEMFFDRNLYVGRKGLSAQGLVMKDNEANDKNVYVRLLRKMLEDGFGERIRAACFRAGVKPIRIFGEIYGPGVQKGFRYGKEDLSFALFDVQIGDEYVSYDEMIAIAEQLGVTPVPLLYAGPFDLDAMMPFRDGKDSISASNMREGLVIKARDGSHHPYLGRKIGKWVSPDYLVKSTGEEFN